MILKHKQQLIINIISGLRDPNYTGENRCLPCTTVNAIIAIAIAVSTTFILWRVFSDLFAMIGGTIILLGSATLIWLRGYLVPGTPTLTKRYFPTQILSWFEKAPDAAQSTATEAKSDVERFLLETGVVEQCDTRDDLCLTDDFAALWESELEATSAIDSQAISSILGCNVVDDLTEHTGGVSVTMEGGLVIQWPSYTAVQVDVAGARVLKQEYPAWNELDGKTRGHILGGLRVFLQNCPDGSETTVQSETVESCCSTHSVSSIICSGSGDKIVAAKEI